MYCHTSYLNPLTLVHGTYFTAGKKMSKEFSLNASGIIFCHSWGVQRHLIKWQLLKSFTWLTLSFPFSAHIQIWAKLDCQSEDFTCVWGGRGVDSLWAAKHGAPRCRQKRTDAKVNTQPVLASPRWAAVIDFHVMRVYNTLRPGVSSRGASSSPFLTLSVLLCL